jgi:hypothetical protein
MKRRYRIALLLVPVLAVFIVWLEPTRVIWGWMRGETFYQGRPTSYWAARIQPWSQIVKTSSWRRVNTYSYGAVRDPLISWLERYVSLPATRWPAVLDGDPDAAVVLHELLDHPESIVREWATEGLHRISEPATGPTVTVSTFLWTPIRSVPGVPGGPPPPPSTWRIHGGVGPAAF